MAYCARKLQERILPMRHLLPGILLLLACATRGFGAGDSREAVRLQKSAAVLNEIMATPEKGIPHDLLNKAVCVGVIPSQKKFALGLGGSFGRGCLVCRRGGNGAWGGPSMFT